MTPMLGEGNAWLLMVIRNLGGCPDFENIMAKGLSKCCGLLHLLQVNVMKHWFNVPELAMINQLFSGL